MHLNLKFKITWKFIHTITMHNAHTRHKDTHTYVNAHTSVFSCNGDRNTGGESLYRSTLTGIYIIQPCTDTSLKHLHKCMESYPPRTCIHTQNNVTGCIVHTCLHAHVKYLCAERNTSMCLFQDLQRFWGQHYPATKSQHRYTTQHQQSHKYRLTLLKNIHKANIFFYQIKSSNNPYR